jgi:hypothetical protein
VVKLYHPLEIFPFKYNSVMKPSYEASDSAVFSNIQLLPLGSKPKVGSIASKIFYQCHVDKQGMKFHTHIKPDLKSKLHMLVFIADFFIFSPKKIYRQYRLLASGLKSPLISLDIPTGTVQNQWRKRTNLNPVSTEEL